MDKSPRYIKLCRGAEAIQRRWQPTYGDFYVGQRGCIRCWLDRREGEHRIKQGFGVRSRGDVIAVTRYIWLPRQDQLIEMAQVRGRSYDHTLQKFFNWTRSDYDRAGSTARRRFPTMEQIWLAFVMHHRYHQGWNGARWVRQVTPMAPNA
jgi:hypothetical protein